MTNLTQTACISSWNLSELIQRVLISEIYTTLGGPKLKHGRGPAFWRKGDNPTAIALDDRKGTWFDHVAGRGGGILALIETVLSSSKGDAVQWLADYAGAPLEELGPRDRTKFRSISEQVPGLARDIADFERGVLLWAETRKRTLWDLYSFSCEKGAESLIGLFERQLLKLAPAIRLGSARPEVVAATYARMVRADPERAASYRRAGREDREHAELITAAIVQILVAASSREKAA